jgi:hypothetical protein
VGTDNYSFLYGTILMVLNTFSAQIVCLFLVVLVIDRLQKKLDDNVSRYSKSLDALNLNSTTPDESSAVQNCSLDKFTSTKYSDKNDCSSLLIKALLILTLIYSLCALTTMVFVYFQRRHLMLWRVFAPKFVFDVAYLVVNNVLVAGVSLLFYIHDRANFAKVKERKV